jgi:hypothetical protein
VEEQLHLSLIDLTENKIRGQSKFVLRVDVEALALRLYGTKLFHDVRGQRRPCRTCLEAGTLSRITAQQAQREAKTRAAEPGTNGWIVKGRPAGPSEDPESGDVWVKYLSYPKDLYFYQDDGFNAGYQLRFCAVTDSPVPPGAV